MISDSEWVEYVAERQRHMKRVFRIRAWQSVRRLRNTAPEQLLADDAAYNRRVLARGWITKYGLDEQQGSGI